MVNRPLGYWRTRGGRIAHITEVVMNGKTPWKVYGDVLAQRTQYGEEPLCSGLAWQIPLDHWSGEPEVWWENGYKHCDAGQINWLTPRTHAYGRLVEYLGPVLQQEWFREPPKRKGCCGRC